MICNAYFKARAPLVKTFLYINKRMALMKQIKQKVTELEEELDDTSEEEELDRIG